MNYKSRKTEKSSIPAPTRGPSPRTSVSMVTEQTAARGGCVRTVADGQVPLLPANVRKTSLFTFCLSLCLRSCVFVYFCVYVVCVVCQVFYVVLADADVCIIVNCQYLYLSLFCHQQALVQESRCLPTLKWFWRMRTSCFPLLPTVVTRGTGCTATWRGSVNR